jgi:mannose-6-phosphate isomerase-like protein (cupin superfamily)
VTETTKEVTMPHNTGSPTAQTASKARLRKFSSSLGPGVSAEEAMFIGRVAGAPFGVKRCVVEVAASLPLDCHSEREVWVITKGRGMLTYQGQSAEVGAGDVVAFDPDVPHEFSNTADEPFELVSIFWA